MASTTMNVQLPASAAEWTVERRLGYFEGQQHTLNSLIAIERSLMRGAANPTGLAHQTPSRRGARNRRPAAAKT